MLIVVLFAWNFVSKTFLTFTKFGKHSAIISSGTFFLLCSLSSPPDNKVKLLSHVQLFVTPSDAPIICLLILCSLTRHWLIFHSLFSAFHLGQISIVLSLSSVPLSSVISIWLLSFPSDYFYHNSNFSSITSMCFSFCCFYFSAEISHFSAEVLIHWKHVLFYFIGCCYNSCFNILICLFQHLVHLQVRHNSFSFFLRMCSIFLDLCMLDNFDCISDIMSVNRSWILLFSLIVLFSLF